MSVAADSLLSLDVVVKFEEDIGEAGNNVALVIVILFFHLPLIFLMYPVKLCHVRPKKVVLFSEIGRVKFFLSTTRPRQSNVYEDIYFLF